MREELLQRCNLREVILVEGRLKRCKYWEEGEYLGNFVVRERIGVYFFHGSV